MLIAVVGPIATADLLSKDSLSQYPDFPKGRAGAPLISTLITEYIRRGHRVLAITVDPAMNSNDAPRVYTDALLTYVVAPSRKRIFRLNGRRMGRVADLYQFERAQIEAILRQYQPEVVHAHWTYEFALAALSYDPNALITVHDNARTILTYVRTLERVFMLLVARLVFQRGQRFTAVSPYMARSVRRWTAAPIHVVGNPISIPAVQPRPALPDNPIICLVANSWEDRKNNQTALLAFKTLQLRHPGAVLWAMGKAFETAGHAGAFCRANDIRNVVLYGEIPYHDVLQKIAFGTVLVHTSLEESFGMVLAEAMSYGVPVVAGETSGAVAWVVDTGGLLVNVSRVDDVAHAVDRLLTDPALYRRLSASAIENVTHRFSIQAIADQYLALYRSSPALAATGQRTSVVLAQAD